MKITGHLLVSLLKKVIKKIRFTSLGKFEVGGLKHELYKTSKD